MTDQTGADGSHAAGGAPDLAASAWRRAVAAALTTYVNGYHRHEILCDAAVPDCPVLFVSNHGFGGLVDLNVLAAVSLRHSGVVPRPTTALVHHMAWTVGVGPLVEALGGHPASRRTAAEAFAAGRNILVFPGGDIDAGKSWRDRNTIVFDGRSGYAALAMEHQVPIVPIVTAGAGESLLVLSDGQRLARALRMPQLLRLKTLPISLSIPWGLSVGAAGLLPYLPLPTKLVTAVMPPVTPQPDESAAALADRVHRVMQARLDELIAHRIPLLG
ncbi:glycerol acyltransferase [Mycobacterium sp. CBMA293]|uniref:1-acyl-sn-glycerol-3-phosphate acyltransferase n=1 Tax=unclassified Mycolicibacterium TaxID=2636767 RepID=UPI0012DCCF0B|nr:MULTISPECIES: 1-acyl-sn-glycerol-3-phosphate acyltransferase [unclassified Mycolicibacterium]MUL49671.1 glycerol acyltransferase [Mycolicibacterium sp. CBMA 360]MUL60106.1 glycerol acyltransferase [Mycolicibacterium sp. CBMA 335]MUL72893.1 glycerol acyltransferase [Mycolicibacterium sp. CBMA 311]MUL96132.1 glycerol acyltransferase [Mycolicibacterium sp. CBMA 230]MUM08147.1 glycerol acyltransferase [Mycolicibacterium sp. CBMA 213]